MAITGNHSALAVTYAQALLELAGDRAEAIGEDLAQIKDVLDANPTFKLYLADPGIGNDQRTASLEKIFKGKVDGLIWNFIGVLNHKNRLGSFDAIIDAYKDLLEDKLGRVEVDLTGAQPLADDQLAAAQQKISAALKKEAVMHTYVDASIIGGVVVRVDDKLIDASVRHQLQAMKEQMLAKMPK
jgi:F-type H+-transporting ATPase subunit delta